MNHSADLRTDRSVDHPTDDSSGRSTIALRPSLYYQRQANRWLTGVRRSAIDDGRWPVTVLGTPIDPLDAMRSELNLANGAVFRTAALLRELRKRAEPIASVRGLVAAEHPHFEELWRAIDGAPEPRTIDSIRRHVLSTGRRAAYRWRTKAGRAVRRARAAAPRVEPADVLFNPRLPGHLADQLPVASALRDAGMRCCFLLDRGDLEPRVRHAGHVAIVTEAVGMRPSQLRRTVDRLASSLEPHLDQLQRDGERCDLEDPELDEVVHRLLVQNTRSIARSCYPTIAQSMRTVSVMLDRTGSAVFVAGNPYTLEGRVGTLVANHRDVSTAAIEHGTIFPDDPIWEECPCDLVCARGEASRDALLQSGVPDHAIAVTGAPRLDDRLAGGRLEPTVPRPGGTILVATSGPGDQVALHQHLGFIDILAGAIQQTPTLEWVIKLHAKDRDHWYLDAIAPESAQRVTIVPTDHRKFGLDIYDSLAVASALVTVYSTSALDAMAVGVPVITVALDGVDDLTTVPFLADGSTRRVVGSAALAAAAGAAHAGAADPPTDSAATLAAVRHFANPGRAIVATADELAALVPEPRPAV